MKSIKTSVRQIPAIVISAGSAVIWGSNAYRSQATAETLLQAGVTDKAFLYTPSVINILGALVSILCLAWALRSPSSKWPLVAAVILFTIASLLTIVAAAARGG